MYLPGKCGSDLQQYFHGTGEKENQIIDYEWMFSFPVPVNFIMWRLIHELYTHISVLPQLIHEDDMMAEFGIGYTDYEIFMYWTLHFVYG